MFGRLSLSSFKYKKSFWSIKINEWCWHNKRTAPILIKDNVFIGHYGFIDSSNGVTIEEGCQIGFYVVLSSHSSHYSIRLYGEDYGGQNMIGYVKGKIHIGKYTFVGAHSTVMPNTNIGKGCIVAAYSYVQGDFPDFSIIAGNPAKVVGDTRKMDEKHLQKHPELREKYDKWAK